MDQQNGNVLIAVVGGALLLASYSGACSDRDPRDATAVDDQVAARVMERCLPAECSVEAVHLADQYVGACTEEWREKQEVRDAQRARGIPDEAP